MEFFTLFTRTENAHLLKDVGMIPETLAKNYPEIRSHIVTYKNGEYPYAGTRMEHAKMVFLKKSLGKCIDGVNFIRKNADRIDVLNIYHLNLSSFLYCLAAKRYLKKGSKIYLKLDLGPAELQKIRKKDPRAFIKRKTLKLADIVSGETTKLVNEFRRETGEDIAFITNGIYIPENRKADHTKKKNRIITVGKLGTPPKNTAFLIDAFAASAPEHDLELRLIGSYTDEVKEKVEDTVLRYPSLKDRIVLLGEITDKERLFSEYEQAKIFVLPSKWESFGFVLPEALCFGDYLLISDNVPLAYDLLYNEDAGRIIEGFEVTKWAREITEAAKAGTDWEKKSRDDRNFIMENYSWDATAKKLYELIKGE